MAACIVLMKDYGGNVVRRLDFEDGDTEDGDTVPGYWYAISWCRGAIARAVRDRNVLLNVARFELFEVSDTAPADSEIVGCELVVTIKRDGYYWQDTGRYA